MKHHVKNIVNQAIESLVESLEQGHSEQLTQYLAAMARFHDYSLHNVLLIAMQRPEASRVAGYRTWQQLGRQVKRGETGIRILSPILHRRSAPAEEEDEETMDVLTGFRTVSVFDITQTDGDALPEFAQVRGDPGAYMERLQRFVATKGIRLEYSHHHRGPQGSSRGGTITLKAGLPRAEAFSTLVHEVAHEMLHANRKDRPESKTVRETEAEAVAFIVCHALGLDINTASSDYIQLYQGDKDTLMTCLERIRTTASSILAAFQSPEHAPTSSRGRERDSYLSPSEYSKRFWKHSEATYLRGLPFPDSELCSRQTGGLGGGKNGSHSKTAGIHTRPGQARRERRAAG